MFSNSNKSIYKIIRSNSYADKYKYKAEINPESPIFKGHFPEKPIIPGVCSIEMIKQCISDIYNENITFEIIKECKFLAIITPELYKSVDVEIRRNDKTIIAEISATSNVEDDKKNTTILMKFKAILK